MSIKTTDFNNKGFTIVELMIATTVLSVILLLATVMITNIGNLYYKGVNQARTQNDARSIVDEMAQNLKLSNGVTPGGSAASIASYCMNNIRYTYIVGVQIGSGVGKSPHVLWRDINPDQSTCVPADLNSPGSGSELIGPNSRIVKLDVTSTAPYEINVALAYGDDDLLCSPSVAGTCNGGATMQPGDYKKGDLLCKGGTAQHFCATTTLSTTVLQRIRASGS